MEKPNSEKIDIVTNVIVTLLLIVILAIENFYFDFGYKSFIITIIATVGALFFLGILIRGLGLLETSISTIVASLIAVPCVTVIWLGLFIVESSLDIIVWIITIPIDVLKEGVIDAFKIIDLIDSFFNEVLYTDTAKFVYYCLSLFLCNLFIGILSNTKQ